MTRVRRPRWRGAIAAPQQPSPRPDSLCSRVSVQAATAVTTGGPPGVWIVEVRDTIARRYHPQRHRRIDPFYHDLLVSSIGMALRPATDGTAFAAKFSGNGRTCSSSKGDPMQ